VTGKAKFMSLKKGGKFNYARLKFTGILAFVEL